MWGGQLTPSLPGSMWGCQLGGDSSVHTPGSLWRFSRDRSTWSIPRSVGGSVEKYQCVGVSREWSAQSTSRTVGLAWEVSMGVAGLVHPSLGQHGGTSGKRGQPHPGLVWGHHGGLERKGHHGGSQLGSHPGIYHVILSSPPSGLGVGPQSDSSEPEMA